MDKIIVSSLKSDLLDVKGKHCQEKFVVRVWALQNQCMYFELGTCYIQDSKETLTLIGYTKFKQGKIK